MNTIEAELRARTGAREKHDLVILDGDAAPHVHHEAGESDWEYSKRARKRIPVKYHRAVNELRVGRDWIVRHYPVTVATARLAGGEFSLPTLPVAPADVEAARWQAWVADRAHVNKIAAERLELERAVRSLDPDEDDRLYA